MRKKLQLFLTLFYISSSLSAFDHWEEEPPRIRDPLLKEKQLKAIDPDAREGSFSQRRTFGPRYFRLYPGVKFESTNLHIKGPSGNAIMSQSSLGEVQFSFDLKTPDWQFTEWFGATLLFRNSEYTLNRQTVEKPLGSNTNLASSPGSSSSSSDSNTERVNLGTRIKGFQSFAIPTVYFGKKGIDHFRIGLGAGPGTISMRGNFDANPIARIMYPLLLANPNDNLINLLGYNAAFGGLQQDPIQSSLLLNLSSGDNLTLYGLYSMAKGDFTIGDPFVTFAALALNKNLTPFEVITLSNISRTEVSIARARAFVWQLFWEVPMGDLNLRLSFGGPILNIGNYKAEFRNFDLTLYMPIDF
ncbi:hypothetical protein [Leptospira idonii]|uniref:DUF3187 family protein n=1 Tax=Leptospira idonii TaxID=1193500 RepID=A0A4R9LYZ0_9LEPT|nr:hypothetical protein [Leptospira idonii]TGN18685.1 hypothetical protein EHS15_15040 [Leptospira idonii]